jgi:hypothetical protein
MPRSRVDLDDDTIIRPPCVRLGEELTASEQRRVVERRRQPELRDQRVQIGLSHGSHAVGYLRQRDPEPRGTLRRAEVRLPSKLPHLDLAALHA